MAPVDAASARRWLPRQLIVEPGTYRVGGESFVLDDPGAYRFESGDGRLLEQRIVLGGSIDDVLVDLSWLWGYGDADNALSPHGRLRHVVHSRVSATCTPLSSDLAAILSNSGFRVRVVLVFTRQELDEEDNGHTLLELGEDRWTLYDPSFRTFFRRGGHRLSLLEWCEAVTEGNYEIEPLKGGLPLLGRFAPESNRLRERMEKLVSSEKTRRLWYKRVGGVPLVRGEDGSYLFDADDPLADVLRSYSPKYRAVKALEFAALWSERSVKD